MVMVKRVQMIPHCPVFYGDPSHVSQLLTWLVILPELLDGRVCATGKGGGFYVIEGQSMATSFLDFQTGRGQVSASLLLQSQVGLPPSGDVSWRSGETDPSSFQFSGSSPLTCNENKGGLKTSISTVSQGDVNHNYC